MAQFLKVEESCYNLGQNIWNKVILLLTISALLIFIFPPPSCMPKKFFWHLEAEKRLSNIVSGVKGGGSLKM